jgi:hypothetical protein
MGQIDEAFQTVKADDFPAMLTPERYGRRSSAFDKIIAATHDHFWDPLDPRYIDFSPAFDLKNQYLVQPKLTAELQTAAADKLSESQKIHLANRLQHYQLSAILHGEQGALNMSANLCHIMLDPGAQEYAANQGREEARHVTGFTQYIKARFGKPEPVGGFLRGLLIELVSSPLVWKKVVGLQMVLEGLAMGVFASYYQYSNDPVLVRLMQLTMTDEAFHHKFGKIWADKTIPHVSKEDRDQIEDWAKDVFNALLLNLSDPEQKQHIYAEVGLDWKYVQGAMVEAFTDDFRRKQMQESTNIFRTLIKTLLKAGIVTERTAPYYAAYVDMKELHAEGDVMVGDAIAEEGIKLLKNINMFAKPASIAAE